MCSLHCSLDRLTWDTQLHLSVQREGVRHVLIWTCEQRNSVLWRFLPLQTMCTLRGDNNTKVPSREATMCYNTKCEGCRTACWENELRCVWHVVVGVMCAAKSVWRKRCSLKNSNLISGICVCSAGLHLWLIHPKFQQDPFPLHPQQLKTPSLHIQFNYLLDWVVLAQGRLKHAADGTRGVFNFRQLP